MDWRAPLKEHEFKPAIRENYNAEGPLFQFELDQGQVLKLCKLFLSSVPRAADAGRKSLLAPPITTRPPMEPRSTTRHRTRPSKPTSTPTSQKPKELLLLPKRTEDTLESDDASSDDTKRLMRGEKSSLRSTSSMSVSRSHSFSRLDCFLRKKGKDGQ